MGVWKNGLFYIFIYIPIYFLFTLLQKFYWLCSGRSDIINQINSGQLYERSAQVFDIQWKRKKEAFQLLNRKNFIATHRSFEHPSYVLSHNVSLLCVHHDMAIFVEVPKYYDVFDCRQSPFIHLGQFEQAHRVITLPLSSFIRLSNELGDSKSKVIWLHSTGRCGSTALGQVFEIIPNCTTISEPMCLFTYRTKAGESLSAIKFRQLLKSDLYANIVRATVRLMCKPNEHNSSILFIKNFTLSGVNDLPILEKEFPDHVHLFLYRDCLPTTNSYIRSLNSHFWMNFVLSLRRNACLRFLIRSPRILLNTLVAPEVIDNNPWMMDSGLQLKATGFGILVTLWISLCTFYIDLYKSGKSKVRAIKYEDVVEMPDATLALLFNFCGIPLDYIDKAKKSLETDSQEGTTLSRSTLSKHKKAVLTDEIRSECNFYLKGFNFPLLGEGVYLPGVLSPRVVETGTIKMPGEIREENSNTHIALDIPPSI